jgi:hypothetical protein
MEMKQGPARTICLWCDGVISVEPNGLQDSHGLHKDHVIAFTLWMQGKAFCSMNDYAKRA